MSILVQIVIACINSGGEADFTFVKVSCTQEQLDEYEHIYTAREWAEEEGYENPMVAYDQAEAPEWLSQQFEWDNASVIPVKYIGK